MIPVFLKRAGEILLVRSGVASAARSLSRHRAVALAYHNIVPFGESAAGELTLHLSQASFARQLDALQRSHEVVPLEELRAANQPRLGRPRAAITFDDAYAGAITAGVDEIVRRGLCATVFVAPAFVGGASFWWDELADRATGALDAAVRERALVDHAGDHEAVLRWAEQVRLVRQTLPAHARAASEEQLLRAAAQPGITLASHSWSHPNLTRLPADQLTEELARPLAWLRERFPRVVPWLAYPYGLATLAVERAAEAAGYNSALLVSGGWLPESAAAQRRYALPRLNVPAGLSVEGFVLRAARLGAGTT